jgi:hypothetical protein
MTYTRVSERLIELATQAIKSGRLIALAMVATFTSMAMQPAQAQSADTWKSVAIIGGSAAVGAYVGHKVGGGTGALVGAGVGAGVGYEIDNRRRANQYYNQSAYNDGGYYGNNGPNGSYDGNSGYYGGQDGGGYPSPAGYQSNNYNGSSRRCSSRR